MDNQAPQPAVQIHPPAENQQPQQPAESKSPATGQPDGSTLAISDKEAQALLAINHMQAPKVSKIELKTKLLIAVVGLILVAVITSVLLGSVGPGGTPKASNLTGPGSSDSNPTSGNGVSNQINQDVKSCSNPVNAVSEC